MHNTQRFTGGDDLKGFEKKVHDVFMKTELNNGYGAYQLSYAETKEGGNSGLSFGGNQMDLANSKKPAHQDLFLRIMMNGKDSSGNKIVEEHEYGRIEKMGIFSKKGKRPETVCGDMLPKINAALSSNYGRQEIDKIYIQELRNKVAHVERAIAGLSNAKNREALNANEELKIRLIDYHNQFTLSYNANTGKMGQMMKFLNGEEVRLVNYEYNEKGEHVTCAMYSSDWVVKRVHPVQLDGAPTVAGINKFIRLTDQYNKSSKGAEGRLRKLDNAFNRTYAKPGAFAYELKDKRFEVEVGDPTDCSLKGSATLVTRSLSLNADLNRLKSCMAHVKYDDHAWLTVNSRTVW